MPPFQILTTEPKTVVQILSSNEKDLFRQAAKALFVVMNLNHQPLAGQDRFEQTVTVEAPDHEGLMVTWLTELLKIAELENVFITDCKIHDLRPPILKAQVNGFYTNQTVVAINAIDYDTLNITRNQQGQLIAELTFELSI